MVEVMQYCAPMATGLHVTGGGQDFVRVYSEQVYGIPPEQVIGSAIETPIHLHQQGQGVLIRRRSYC